MNALANWFRNPAISPNFSTFGHLVIGLTFAIATGAIPAPPGFDPATWTKVAQWAAYAQLLWGVSSGLLSSPKAGPLVGPAAAAADGAKVNSPFAAVLAAVAVAALPTSCSSFSQVQATASADLAALETQAKAAFPQFCQFVALASVTATGLVNDPNKPVANNDAANVTLFVSQANSLCLNPPTSALNAFAWALNEYSVVAPAIQKSTGKTLPPIPPIVTSLAQQAQKAGA